MSMLVKCKFHGWVGVIAGYTTEDRPIIQWENGMEQSRPWEDLIGVT